MLIPSWDDFEPVDAALIAGMVQVDVVDREPTGVLLGPDGRQLVVVWDRRVVPFGFQPPQR